MLYSVVIFDVNARKFILSLILIGGIFYKGEAIELEKFFADLVKINLNDPYFTQRTSVDPTYSFDYDPWVKVAKEVSEISSFQPFKRSDSQNLKSALNACKGWEETIMGSLSKLNLNWRYHKGMSGELDVIASVPTTDLPMEFRQTSNIWVWKIDISSPKGKATSDALLKNLAPNSTDREGFSYFRGTPKLGAYLRECIYWKNENYLILSGSKILVGDPRMGSFLHDKASNCDFF